MIKMLEEKIGQYFYDCWVGMNELPKQDTEPKIISDNKIYRYDWIKVKNHCKQRQTKSNRFKRNVCKICNRGLIFTIHEKFQQTNTKNTNNLVEK